MGTIGAPTALFELKIFAAQANRGTPMTPASYRSSSSDSWSAPKAHIDPCRRRMIYGRIQPMDEDRGLLQRLFGRH
jgi:hypothetical protein